MSLCFYIDNDMSSKALLAAYKFGTASSGRG